MAVEFALIVPVLVLLIFGAIEFSYMYYQQLGVTNAARSAARSMAVGNVVSTAVGEAILAAPGLNPALTSSNITFAPVTCAAGGTMTVTISYPAKFLTGLFGNTLTIKGKAAWPCGG